MKKVYEKPVQAETDYDVLLPVAYSIQLGDGEDDVVLGAHQRDFRREGIEQSLWQTSEECALEEEQYFW